MIVTKAELEAEVKAIEGQFTGLNDLTGMKSAMIVAKHMGIRAYELQLEILAELRKMRIAIEGATGGKP